MRNFDTVLVVTPAPPPRPESHPPPGYVTRSGHTFATVTYAGGEGEEDEEREEIRWSCQCGEVCSPSPLHARGIRGNERLCVGGREGGLVSGGGMFRPLAPVLRL